MYEIHIAIPVVECSVMRTIFAEFAVIGLKKTKFFYNVKDIRPADASCHPAGTPPTGHDLANPGAMATAKVETYEEARKILLDGMTVLGQHGIHGNFEIEGFVSPKLNYPEVNIEQDFPGYRRVADAPNFENHIIWKAARKDLPTMNQIIKFFEESLGTTPHQIVDFGRDEEVTDETIVSRVATVYQPSAEAATVFAEVLAKIPNTLNYRYGVAEQVLLVGEAI